MAYLDYSTLTNSQVFLHWPARHGRGSLVSLALARLQLWRDRSERRAELDRLRERELQASAARRPTPPIESSPDESSWTDGIRYPAY